MTKPQPSPVPPAATSPIAVARSRSAVAVPTYSLYGEEPRHCGWFVNVESLDLRAREQNWTIDPHTHPRFTQLVFVGNGGGEMTIDGDVFAFAAPAVLTVPPFHIHSFKYEQSTEGWVVTIENDFFAELLARAPELRSVMGKGGVSNLSSRVFARLQGSIAALRSEVEGDRRGRLVGAEVQLLNILLTLLRERPAAVEDANPGRAEVVDRFLTNVEKRFRDQPDLGEFADDLGVTLAQLRLACKARTGLSPLAIVHDRILAEAKRCLTYSTLSVAEIGYRLGFADAAYFSRFFAGKVGLPPTEFRRSRAH